MEVTFQAGSLRVALLVYLVNHRQKSQRKGRCQSTLSFHLCSKRFPGPCWEPWKDGWADGTSQHKKHNALLMVNGPGNGTCLLKNYVYFERKYFFLIHSISFHLEWIWLAYHFLLFLPQMRRECLTGCLKLGRITWIGWPSSSLFLFGSGPSWK